MKSQRAFALFPTALLMAGFIAAAGWPATAHAEPSGDSVTDRLTKLGQSLCPKLVKPGSDLAANASRMRGDSGLTPEIARLMTAWAIQLQCPAMMESIAKGDLQKLLAKQDAPANPFPLPGIGH